MRSRQLAALWLALPDRTQPCTHMLMFCLAFSMSFLISGVMLNRSFLGMGRGTIGDRTSSGFFLHGTGGSCRCHRSPSVPRTEEGKTSS